MNSMSCSEQKVVELIQEAERRWSDRLEQSHTAINGTVSDFGGEIKDINTNVKELRDLFKEHIDKTEHLLSLDTSTLGEMSTSWKGFVSMKSVILGFASVMIALGAIGAGLTAFIKMLLK